MSALDEVRTNMLHTYHHTKRDVPIRITSDQFGRARSELMESEILFVNDDVKEENFVAWGRVFCKEMPPQ